MKILIDTPCKEELDKVVYYVKQFCIEHFQEFKLFIDDKLKFEQKKK